MTTTIALYIALATTPQGIDDLIKGLDGDKYFASQRRLVLIGEPAVPALIQALTTGKDAVSLNAATCLAALRDKRAVAPLREKVESAEEGDTYHYSWALGSTGDKAALDWLLSALLKGESDDTIGASAEGIRAFGPGAFDAISKAFAQPQKDDVAIELIGLLAFCDEEKAVPILIRALDHPSDLIRAEACRELGWLSARQATQRVIRLLSDPARDVKLAAVDSLGWIGDPAAVPPLLALLTSTDSEVVTAAIFSLSNLQDIRSLAPIQALETSSDESIAEEAKLAVAHLEIWAPADEFARHALLSLSSWGQSPESKRFFEKWKKEELIAELDRRWSSGDKRSHTAIAYSFVLAMQWHEPASQLKRIGQASAYVEGVEPPESLASALDYVGSAIDEILLAHPSPKALAAAFDVEADGHAAEELYEILTSFAIAHPEMAIEASSLIEDGIEQIAEVLWYGATMDLSDYLKIDRAIRNVESSGSGGQRQAAQQIRSRWEALMDE